MKAMSWKRQSVSMPSANAGILGISSDTDLDGVKVDPKFVAIGVFAFIVIVKVAGFLFSF